MANLVMIVEDEMDLVNILEFNLKREGYETRSVFTATAALEQVKRSPLPDLVLLDLMLPDFSGIDVFRQLRQQEGTRHVPVVMLTAKGQESDRLVGLELGADDYVVKPFSMRELMLRIKAILRRSKQQEEAPEQIAYGSLQVDVPGHQARVGGKELSLTAMEFKLLMTLLSRRGRVQSRDALLSSVWSIDADIDTRTVDTHIKNLRRKLGPIARHLKTRRGVGYYFNADENGDN